MKGNASNGVLALHDEHSPGLRSARDHASKSWITLASRRRLPHYRLPAALSLFKIEHCFRFRTVLSEQFYTDAVD